METPLRTARVEMNFTARRLADAAGTKEMRIVSLERGRFRPRADEAKRLAAVLVTPVEELFPDGVQPRRGEGAKR